jgi:hypothetical protein
LYHLFWSSRQDASAWHHETFEDQQALNVRRDTLQQSAGSDPASIFLMRSFHFPTAIESVIDISELESYLSRFAHYEIQDGAAAKRTTGGSETTTASQNGNQALVRVGAKTYQLKEADATILRYAIAAVTRNPASEEFLPLMAPDAVIVLVVDGAPAEYELYDDWTTLADLVTGHWPFPQGKELRALIESGLVAAAPADPHGAD